MDIFLQHLIDLDKLNKKETIFYSGMSSTMQMLLYILIMNKYKNNCYLHLEIPENIYETYTFFSRSTSVEIIANQLISCINNNTHIIIIPYALRAKNFSSAHANMLIYKVIGNIHQIDHFEPHGEQVGNKILYEQQRDFFQSQIFQLQKLIKQYYDKKNIHIEQIYNTSSDICPTEFGLQTKHEMFMINNNNSGMFGVNEDSGLCGYWSFFLAELVLKFQDLQTSAITMKLLDYSPDDLNHIIRGYIFYNNDKLLKLYKHFSKIPLIKSIYTKQTQEQILYERLHNYIYKKYLKNSLFSFMPNMFKRGGKKIHKNKTCKKKKKNKNTQKKR